MDIETAGAIRLFFPNPSLTLVYFEALANALDAGATEVSIDIDVQAFDKPDTLKIAVSDNGDGFTDENFERFRKLLRPRDKFHKGIGRLVFLNYFSRVEVTSTRDKWRRSFVFKDGFDGNAPLENLKDEQPAKTTLVFNGFAKDRVKSYDDLKPDALKPLLIEQFLPTLDACKRDGTAFKISISLQTKESNAQKEFFPHETVITADDLPSMTKITIQDDSLDAFSTIDMLYHVEPVSGKGSLLVAFSIDGRTIPVNLIPTSSFPPGYMGVFLFESEMFHSNADSSRQKLILPESLPVEKLYRVLRREVGKVLADKIPKITEKNELVKEKFEEQFPHLLGYFENDTVGLIDRDDALDIAQQKFFRAQKQVLQCEILTEAAYEKSLELSSRTLTEYILYRDKIIGRMKEMTADNAESEIHNLIVPRFKEFSQEDMPSEIYQNNAWLLDDKFMVFRTILSEQRMDTVVNAIRLDEESGKDAGRPDIAMIFSADPKDASAVDVVVIEIKKKTDDEKENQYAINQLLDRAVKLAAHCPNIQRIWYYAVIQISDTMGTRLRQQNWAPLFSMGKLYYQEFRTERPDGTVVPTPTFVVSFDAIVADAESRNHTFLEILRNGMKEYANKQAPSQVGEQA
ncbi:ATP-binding protein [Achromobacter mucicolens]|uniref:ATP-binding protein n=2 Tax=Burkholderiales TaxID=80840 RepID=A0ABD4YPY3_9BURK|nr:MULTISPECIES: ATP-binding protein [Pseudomonadota]MCW3525619.1 ATP-binding protein [Burkholderia cenocepacia]MCW3615856.1 ATP-binding protein [Burkholderia cenocepacia]MCW3653852.1 ATP-binding protein [Burkholderia cenocepacia]MCW3670364.1 ATP-binding protein [Burkholderia cenocepacia]MCW3685204.1 ATP-binding protein [Burkholderia cenocepacia]